MTEIIQPSRRGFLTGLGAVLITAPAIVRAGSLMPVKRVIDLENMTELEVDMARTHPELVHVLRRAFGPRRYFQLWQPDFAEMFVAAANA